MRTIRVCKGTYYTYIISVMSNVYGRITFVRIYVNFEEKETNRMEGGGDEI